MTIIKSKRHSKYIGFFGEALVCNLLSRSGFEVMHADHVGIDVVASRNDIGRIGISVKSRTRDARANEFSSVNLFPSSERALEDACKDFGLEPWLAVYVETEGGADLYLTSLENFHARYAGAGTTMLCWKMGEKHRNRYQADPLVMHMRLEFAAHSWFGSTQNTA